MVYHPDHPERRSVYIDDECEFCKESAKHLDLGDGVSIVHASSEKAAFISKDALKRDLHAMDEHGVMHKGIDAVILIMRWHSVGRYVAPILALPGFKQAGGLVYRIVSANRHRWSGLR